jgi:hypothetical protein
MFCKIKNFANFSNIGNFSWIDWPLLKLNGDTLKAILTVKIIKANYIDLGPANALKCDSN